MDNNTTYQITNLPITNVEFWIIINLIKHGLENGELSKLQLLELLHKNTKESYVDYRRQKKREQMILNILNQYK